MLPWKREKLILMILHLVFKQIRSQIKELQDKRDELLEKIGRQTSDFLDINEVNKYVDSTRELLSSSTFTERKTFLAAFIERIELDEPKVIIDYRLLPNDVLTRREEVLSIKRLGSPTRARTWNLAVNSRALYHLAIGERSRGTQVRENFCPQGILSLFDTEKSS